MKSYARRLALGDWEIVLATIYPCWTSDDGFGIIIDGSLSGPNFPADGDPGDSLGKMAGRTPIGSVALGIRLKQPPAAPNMCIIPHADPNAEPVTPVPTTTPPTATPTSIYTAEPTPTGPPTPEFCLDNLLLNASFEDWTAGPSGPPDNWTISTANITATQETGIVFTGSSSANLTFTSTTTQYITQVVTVEEGEPYEFNLWVYDNDPGGRVRLYGYWQKCIHGKHLFT